HKLEIAQNTEVLSQIPEELTSDPDALEHHIRCLNQVAICLANECDAPELWNQLQVTPADSPLLALEQWISQLPERVKNLEHPVLVSEACSWIESTRSIPSQAARQSEAALYQRLGEFLFHSGQVSNAEKALQTALKLSQDLQDSESQRATLIQLLDVHRHAGNRDEAIRAGENARRVTQELGLDGEGLRQQIARMTQGEALCRVVCMRDDVELEVDEITTVAQGRYEFQFRRNRPSLQMALGLTKQGNELGSTGKLAEALEKYQAARQIDPFDPDPVYQSGVCYLELRKFSNAREAFEEVDQLAPGWFRCRSDKWISKSLEDGTITDEQFRVLRVLEDGKVDPEQAMQALLKMLNKHPGFAPFYLLLGDRYREKNDLKTANSCYRKGLELVTEPDFESRLLCAAAVILAKESPDRTELLQRAISLEGSLVAQATAKLLLLQ
ncbi:MAG: type secretion system chaperone protein SscB, partial [Planctomycetaceae bacterium]|nr:type secretion system chaperone protein SscB [Planctomycetaceae bacterium]